MLPPASLPVRRKRSMTSISRAHFSPAALVCTRLIKTTISAMTKQIIEMTMNMILIIYRRIDQTWTSWEE